ncbi:unnamed protein product [Mesocestoides corti]|uniref:Uncharacterized protein n=1 Tax=Mesocestoides corti TaxID=53468 RepID=A0A0R3UP74_MESCO|nr:unnamed protein product [Mesocestoides corti]
MDNLPQKKSGRRKLDRGLRTRNKGQIIRRWIIPKEGNLRLRYSRNPEVLNAWFSLNQSLHRFFVVRLPALVNQMALTRCRRSIVLRHLYLFVAYLDQTKDFWFTSTPPSTPGPTIEPLTPDDASRIKRIRNASAASSGSSTHQTSISKIRSGAKIVPRRVTVPRLRGASRKRPTPELRTHSTSSTIHLLFVMLEFRFIRWRHCIVLPQHRVWYF